jgi:Ca2+-transporting ATPase
MGARGTDVARESAALVITDDDFSSIVGGIRQGRGIFANMRKAMAYIIAVHVPIAGMSLLPVFVGHWPLVLLPVQIAFLELIIDPSCSVVFEAEPIEPGIMDERPRGLGEPVFSARVLTLALLQGASVLAAVFGVYLWGIVSGRGDDAVRSLTFTALVLGNLALILVNRSWRLSVWRTMRERRNGTLGWVLVLALAMLTVLLTVPATRRAFHLGPITWTDAVVALAAAVISVAWFEIYKAVSRSRQRRAAAGARALPGATL